MKIHYTLFIICVCLLAACGEGDLGEIKTPSDGYSLPQGGDEKADARIQQYYDKYNCYFLYEFTEKDFQWTMVNTSTGGSVYTYTPLKTDSINSLLDVLELSWLPFYPEDYLKQAMPKRIFLCQQVLGKSLFSDSYSEYPCRYLTYQLAVANPGVWEDLDELEQKEYRCYLNSMFLLSCYNSGNLTIPDAFFEISDYTNTDTGSRKKARNAGFVKNERTGIEWATQGNSLTKTDDVDAYLSSLVYRTEDEWASDLTYDKVARKYAILKQMLKDMGIDIEGMSDPTD